MFQFLLRRRTWRGNGDRKPAALIDDHHLKRLQSVEKLQNHRLKISWDGDFRKDQMFEKKRS
jgi:hypothetical protein